MNIYDVSKKANVSIATVSRVLNGNQNVSDKTRAKVLAVMDELGYKPNIFARGLGLNTMQTVGIMCSDSSDLYLANAIYFLERDLRAHGYDAILCCTGNELSTKQKYFDLLTSKRVDAIILAGSKFIEMKPKDNQYILDAAKHIPIMLVNGRLDGENIYSTVCDDHDAMFQATSRLIESGIKKPLYLFTSFSYSGLNKRRGFEDAMKEHHLTLDDGYIRQCPKDISAARELLTRLHHDGLEFDAVLASSDTLAVGAIKYAHQFGLAIPDTLSIIGYNNSVLSESTTPAMTSVDSKVEALCINTVNTLMGVFSGTNVPAKTTISADLIKRETTRFG